MDYLPKGYRPNVGALIVNSSRQVWMGKRKTIGTAGTSTTSWQMPQGGIENTETPAEALWREVYEETGMVSLNLLSEYPEWITYDLPEELLSAFWGGKFRGQIQRWFALEFTGKDNEITLQPNNDTPAEFSQWQWVTPSEVPSRAVHFKRQVYHTVLDGFAPYLK